MDTVTLAFEVVAGLDAAGLLGALRARTEALKDFLTSDAVQALDASGHGESVAFVAVVACTTACGGEGEFLLRYTYTWRAQHGCADRTFSGEEAGEQTFTYAGGTVRFVKAVVAARSTHEEF